MNCHSYYIFWVTDMILYMLSASEVFVTETLKKCIEKELKKANLYSKKDVIEVECPDNWLCIEDESEFPYYGETRILDEDGNNVGKVCWKTRFFINEDATGKYIDAEPIITKLKYKGEVVVNK